ncbi:MAG: hypothetical protein IPJ34_31570 [Myxococcales bacterium]|nr:hypothetical protein [Myxococcales bacterium]
MGYREASVRDRALHTVGWAIAGSFLLVPLLACSIGRLGYDLVPSQLADDLGNLVFGSRLSRGVALVTWELLKIPPELALAGGCAVAFVMWWCARRTEVWIDERRQLLVARTTRFPLPVKLVSRPLAEVRAVRPEWRGFLRRWVAIDEFDLRTTLCVRFGGRREVAALDAHVRRLRGD